MKPLFTHIIEAHKISANCIIIREACDNFPKLKSNIYCVQADREVKWFAELPFADDSYPNQILLDTKIDKYATEYADLYASEKGVFTTSSSMGVTVTVDISSGKIVDSEVTK